MRKTMITRSLLFVSLLYFGFTFSANAFERVIVGKDTLMLFAYPIEVDSVLSAKVHERLSGAYSTGCRRGYRGVWRLENDTLFLEKIVDYYSLSRPGEKGVLVDTDGIFDAYKRGGRIAALWFSGKFKVFGGKCITEQGLGFVGRYEREWTYEVERGRVVSRQACENSLKKADCSIENGMSLVASLFNGDRFPELADKCLFFEADVIPKENGSIDSLNIRVAVVDKDSTGYKYTDRRKWIKNDFSNPYIQELKTCMELIPGWDYLVVDGRVQPVRTWDILTAWEGKGCKARYEVVDFVSQSRRDMLTWNDTTYFLDYFPFQYDMNLYARLRPLLKDDFSPSCSRGYTACWEIREGRLYLQSLHHGKNDSIIPLNVVFPGNEGEPVEATWYTGQLLLPLGGQLEEYYPRSDFSPLLVYNEEIFCDIREGKVVGKTVYHNSVRKGDSEFFARGRRKTIDFDWDKFPELKGKELHCSYFVQPKADGSIDSIRILLRVDETGREYGKNTIRITDPDHPYVVIFREALNRVKWDVANVRGKIEPVEGSIADHRRESGLRIKDCVLQNFKVEESYMLGMLCVKPKNFDQIVKSLNGKIARGVPYKKQLGIARPWEAFRQSESEIINRCIPFEVREVIRQGRATENKYLWPSFHVYLLIDQTGKIHSACFTMTDNIYPALTENLFQVMYDALMQEEPLSIARFLDFSESTGGDWANQPIGYGVIEFAVGK